MTEDDYEIIYYKMNPSVMPHSQFHRVSKLNDLWPCDAEKIKRQIDAVVAALEGK